MRVALLFVVLLTGCASLKDKTKGSCDAGFAEVEDLFMDEEIQNFCGTGKCFSDLADNAICALAQPLSMNLLAKNVESFHLKLEMDVRFK